VLSVALVFAVNDVLALRSFNTFLNNFVIHEKPNFIERWAAKRAQGWIQSRAMTIFKDIRRETADKQIDLALNQCGADMFAVLSLSTQPSFQPTAGDELFLAIAAAELAFKKLQSPRSEEIYK